jgi:hypothetical protein
VTKERKNRSLQFFFRPIDDHMSWKTEGRKRGWLRERERARVREREFDGEREIDR